MRLHKVIFISFLSFISLHSSQILAATESSKDVGTIIVGSADFPESQLLATIYAGALSNKNIKVEKRLNIGSREVYIPALLDGSINLIPEYSGSVLSYLDNEDQAHSKEDVAKALQKKLPSGVNMLNISEAQDRDVLVVTQKTASTFNLKTLDDLAPVATKMILGAAPEWKNRRIGVVGLQEVYGIKFKAFRSLDVAGPLTLSALNNNQIQVGNFNSTTPEIKKFHLVILDDTKNLFIAQNIVPLISSKYVSEVVVKTLNDVSSKLTTDDLITMNVKLSEFETVDDVAKEWLSKHNL